MKALLQSLPPRGDRDNRYVPPHQLWALTNEAVDQYEPVLRERFPNQEPTQGEISAVQREQYDMLSAPEQDLWLYISRSFVHAQLRQRLAFLSSVGALGFLNDDTRYGHRRRFF